MSGSTIRGASTSPSIMCHVKPQLWQAASPRVPPLSAKTPSFSSSPHLGHAGDPSDTIHL